MRRFVWLMVAAMLGIASPVFAQSASVSGRVTDTQGGAVVGADVRVSRDDGAVAQHVTSDATGNYRIESLPAGVFIVDVDKRGFRRRTEVVTLTASHATTVDVELGVGGVDDAVIVTATGQSQVAHETSKPVTVIDADAILARNETTLGEIVRFAPGVQIRNSGGPGQATSMRIRGLRQDAAAVLIDGLRFRDASTAQGDVSPFMQALSFIDVDRVEVMRGSGSSLYGTNAVGGVVNVVTKAGGGALHGEGQVEGGSLGQFRTRGSLGGGALDNRLRYSAGVLQFNMTDGLDGNDDTRSTGGHGQLTYNVSPTANLMVRLLASDDRVNTNVSPTASGVPAANIPNSTIVPAIPVAVDQITRANAGLPFDIGNATYIPGRDDLDSTRDSSFYSTALAFRHSGWSMLSWQASYQRVRTDRTYNDGPLGSGFQPTGDSVSNFVGTIDTVDVRGFSSPTPWLSLTAGYEFEREGYFDRQGSNSPVLTQTQTRIHQNGNAGFAAAQFALLDRRLQVAFSGRVQGFAIANPELTANGSMNPYDGVPVSAPPRATTGDVSVAYMIASSNTKLRAHGGNAYRAAGLYERFGGGFFADPVTGIVAFTAYGDPRLRPDRYKAIDGGVDQYLFQNRLFISATAFYNDVTSLTAFDSSGVIRPETDPYGRTGGYINGAGGFSRGFELGAEARPVGSLRVSGSYTYTRSETSQDITVPGFYIVPGVFEHTATLVVTNRWNDRLDTTFDVFAGSKSYGSFFAAGRSRAFEYPGFTKAALIAGYRVLNSTAWPLRAYVKIDNLFNQTYYEGGWRNLGRTAVAGVSVGF